MIPRYYISGSQTARPDSRGTLFADGSADSTVREGVDLELSHWLPNRTPASFKADTSTEICMNFIETHSASEWDIALDLAVNNHLDVDGILSVYTLVHSETARSFRNTIVQAAEMGDFWAWGEPESARLFQGLTLEFNRLRALRADILEIYSRCFQQIPALLQIAGESSNRSNPGIPVISGGPFDPGNPLDPEGSLDPGNPFDPESPEIERGLESLRLAALRVESGLIERRMIHERLVSYRIPLSLTEASIERALRIPTFNSALSDDQWLPPQARNRLDKERVQLVSSQTNRGWHHDLWYPGYMWADTPNSWRAPGFHFSGSTNGYYYGHDPLSRAVERLRTMEGAQGTWVLAERIDTLQLGIAPVF